MLKGKEDKFNFSHQVRGLRRFRQLLQLHTYNFEFPAAVGDSGDGGDGGLVNGGEVSEPVAPEPNEDDEWGDDYDDDDDSDEENQAFTSDEEQESDAESSDDPDFMGECNQGGDQIGKVLQRHTRCPFISLVAEVN